MKKLVLTFAIVVIGFGAAFGQTKVNLELDGFNDPAYAKSILGQMLKTGYSGLEMVDVNSPGRNGTARVEYRLTVKDSIWVTDEENQTRVDSAREQIIESNRKIESYRAQYDGISEVTWRVRHGDIANSGARAYYRMLVEKQRAIIAAAERLIETLPTKYEQIVVTASVTIQLMDLQRRITSEKVGHIDLQFARKYRTREYDRAGSVIFVDDDTLEAQGWPKGKLLTAKERYMSWLLPSAVADAFNDPDHTIIGR